MTNVQTILRVIEEMLHEAQLEASDSLCACDRIKAVAARDALDELKFRIRDDRVNTRWIHIPRKTPIGTQPT